MNRPIAPVPLWVRVLITAPGMAVLYRFGPWAGVVAQVLFVVVLIFWAAWLSWGGSNRAAKGIRNMRCFLIRDVDRTALNRVLTGSVQASFVTRR